jgi:hypothetical protein
LKKNFMPPTRIIALREKKQVFRVKKRFRQTAAAICGTMGQTEFSGRGAAGA